MIPIPRESLVILLEGGYIYLRMGKFEEAREVFEGISALTPESEVPLVALGSVFFAQMKYDQAIRWYKKALAIKEDSAFAHAYLGETLLFKGKAVEARKELEKASELDPKGHSGNFARALLDAVKKGFAEVEKMRQH